MKRILILVLLIITFSTVNLFAATQTINTLPSSNATFMSDLQTFLRGEISDRAFRGASGVMYGGIGATDASLTHTISAFVAFPDGYYVSQTATSRTYTATRRTYVYVRKDSSVTVTIFGATVTYSTNLVYVEMTAASEQPATPAGIIPLFYADTDGTSITAVTDLRVGRASLAYWDTLSDALTAIGTSLKMTLVVPERYIIAATTDAKTYTNIKFDMLEANGSFEVSATKTLTLSTPAAIIAAMNQQIFSGSGTVSFAGITAHIPGGSRISVMWYGAKGNGTTDDYAALVKAFASAGTAAYQYSIHAAVYSYTSPELYFPTGHYVTSNTLVDPPGRIVGDRAFIRGSDITKDIFDYQYVYQVYIKGITFVDGKSHIAFSNPHGIGGQMLIEDCEFYYSSDYAIKSYTPCVYGAPLDYFDFWGEIRNCRFIYNRQVLKLSYNNVFKVLDTFAAGGDTAVAEPYILNQGRLYLDNYDISPGVAVAGAAHIYNYGGLYVTNSRFGSENNGRPIVYHYETTHSTYVNPDPNHMGWPVISLKNSTLLCGATGLENTIIRLMTGIPGLIEIIGNNYIAKDTTDFIKVDGGFNIVTYIGAIDASQQNIIHVESNQSYVPLEVIGLPALLTDVDTRKIIVNAAFKPYIKGYKGNGLLHFDGDALSTTIRDEYRSSGIWSVAGNAKLNVGGRFGPTSLALDGTGDYIDATTYITSLGSYFTIEGWFYTSDHTVQDQFIFLGVNAAVKGVYLALNEGGSTHLDLSVSSNGTTNNIADSVAGAATFADNTWYKWVIERDSTGNYNVYVGQAGAAVTLDITAAGAAPCAIGTMFSVGNGFKGAIDEFRYRIGSYRYGGLFVPESEAFKVE